MTMLRLSKWIMFVSMALLMGMVFFILLPYSIFTHSQIVPKWMYCVLGIILFAFMLGGALLAYVERKIVISTIKDMLK